MSIIVNGKTHYKWVIFHGYVSLPEGNQQWNRKCSSANATQRTDANLIQLQMHRIHRLKYRKRTAPRLTLGVSLCVAPGFSCFSCFFFAGSIKKSINKILYIPWRIHGAGIYANIKGYIDGIHGTPYILDLDLRYVNIILFSRGSNICLAPKNCERPGEVDRNSLLASGCL